MIKELEIHQHGEYRTRRLVLEAWDWIKMTGIHRHGDVRHETVL
ncbi:hypothetical protein [Ruegeria aquimaris]|uniref:Uncharacterized protein n=1 Tax=Ruegeria aquimaris TaxID=2984333 RepID=A0ABT3ARW3_9RHOB|nr:hypothetical protein [Ruegeria sp. XHP0148]MCV2891424.1 hypothetical protein [Ruegeria sp. XHP0148]